MGGIFGGGAPPPPAPIPEPPARSDKDIQASALEARQRRAAATGRSETILTGGAGVTEDASTATVTLLGEG